MQSCFNGENIKVALWREEEKKIVKRDNIAAKCALAHARTHSYRNLAGILQWRCGRWQEDKVLMRSLHYLAVGPFCFLCLTILPLMPEVLKVSADNFGSDFNNNVSCQQTPLEWEKSIL